MCLQKLCELISTRLAGIIVINHESTTPNYKSNSIHGKIIKECRKFPGEVPKITRLNGMCVLYCVNR